MGKFLENLVISTMLGVIAAHARAKRAFTKDQVIRYLRSFKADILADMVEVVPEDRWNQIARLTRRL